MTKGERIKRQRESLDISQTDLAKRVGVSKQSLYKYENDIITNVPSDIIEKLASELDCTPAYIMGWDEVQSFETSADFELAWYRTGGSEHFPPNRFEIELILAFRAADKITQDNICKLLDVKRGYISSKEA